MVDIMADKKHCNIFSGPFANEIEEFVDFKQQSGSLYASSELALKAFDRFCGAVENQSLTPQQLAEVWIKPGDFNRFNSSTSSPL